MMENYFTVLPALAHGDEAESAITASDYAGPVIALLIIVAAIMIARRIRKNKKYESNISAS